MTASTREKRTLSFDEAHGQSASSDFVASRAESIANSMDPSSNQAVDLDTLPLDLRLALRAARTPLIAGIDFKSGDLHRDALLPGIAPPELQQSTKSRVDTLSPLESVPPPAPYLSEPPPQRPSVVPPVRRPYVDQHALRARDDQSARIRSEPPPRIPISDRPSRPAYRSEPPPRLSRSDPPPPQSSRRGPGNARRSWGDGDYGPTDAMADSLDARRREAVTIPADQHSPSQAPAYDPSLPLPALRTPSFAANHLPAAYRQHENSRLRNVAMTMMFVICIVTGAIAGMRWYVARDNDLPLPNTTVDAQGPRTPRMKLDRLAPNAVVAPRDPNSVESGDVESPLPAAQPAQKSANRGKATPNDAPDGEPDATNLLRDPAMNASPWQPASIPGASAARAGSAVPDSGPTRPKIRPEQSSGSTPAPSLSSRKSDTRVRDPKKVDTKTPLIMD